MNVLRAKIVDGEIVESRRSVTNLVNGELPDHLKNEGWVIVDETTNTPPSAEQYETVIEYVELVNGKALATYSKKDKLEDLAEFKEQATTYFTGSKNNFITSVLNSESFLKFVLGGMSETEANTYKTETLNALNGHNDNISDVDDATDIQGVKDVF